MEVDMSARGTILFKPGPAATTGRFAVVVTEPGELNAREPVPLPVDAVHPTSHSDELELTLPALVELDERRADQVDIILIPLIHFGYAPCSRDVRHGTPVRSLPLRLARTGVGRLVTEEV